MTKENIHPVIQSRICCQDSRWMSEYWWSWKLCRVPVATSLQWRMGWSGEWVGEGRGGLILGFHGERGAALNIQNPGVQCRLLKGDQSHFEAHGASFVCERCEVLPKWLGQFFKTHLQLTPSGSALGLVCFCWVFFFSLFFLTPFFVLKMGVEVLQTRDWTWLQAQVIKLYL